MKAKDIPIYTIPDWLSTASPFAVTTLTAGGDAARERRGRPHRNNFYTIYWITGGQARVTIDMVTYTVRENTLLFIAPVQVSQVVELESCEGWWIAFDETFYCLKDPSQNKGVNVRLFFNPDFSTLLSMDEGDRAALRNIVSMMEDECRGMGEQYSNAFYALLQVFLIRVSRMMEKEEPK